MIDRLHDCWYEFIRIKRPNWARKTLSSYEATGREFLSFFSRNINLSSVCHRDIHSLIYDDKYYKARNGRKIRPKTKAKRFDHLSHFFSWCVSEGFIEYKQNPMNRIDHVVTDNEIPPIPNEREFIEFLNRCPYPWNYYTALLGTMGNRAGELFCNGRDWTPARYDSQGAVIFNKTKTHKARKVPLPEHESIRQFVGKCINTTTMEIDFGVRTLDIYYMVKAIWRSMHKPDFSVKTFRTFAINMMLSRTGSAWFTSKCVGNTERTIRRSYGHSEWRDFIPLVNATDLSDAHLFCPN